MLASKDIRTYIAEELSQLKTTLMLLTPEEYSCPLCVLHHSSIGAHVRHVLEFYVCLLRENTVVISYDARERNKRLERDLVFAMWVIQEITSKVIGITQDFSLVLNTSLSAQESASLPFETTLFRELLYCLEHSIHHQALIKIGFCELSKESLLTENFSVAPSTVRHQHWREEL